MKVDCYSMTVYCDGLGTEYGHRYGGGVYETEFHGNKAWVDGSVEAIGRNRRECMREVRKHGWKVGKKDYCPLCLKRKVEESNNGK